MSGQERHGPVAVGQVREWDNAERGSAFTIVELDGEAAEYELLCGHYDSHSRANILFIENYSKLVDERNEI